MIPTKTWLRLLAPIWILAMTVPYADANVNPEINALLQKARSDLQKLDPKKLTSSCKKAISKCRSKALTLFQAIKYIQENPKPFLESACFVENLRRGILRPDVNCDMNGTFGTEIQCFKDPIIKKAVSNKSKLIVPFVNCIAANSENFDKNNPNHRF